MARPKMTDSQRQAQQENALKVIVELCNGTHYRSITREQIATALNSSTGYVSELFGNMIALRQRLVTYAIKIEALNVIGQAIAVNEPAVRGINKRLVQLALQELAP